MTNKTGKFQKVLGYSEKNPVAQVGHSAAQGSQTEIERAFLMALYYCFYGSREEQ
jgi:hypothetical protein